MSDFVIDLIFREKLLCIDQKVKKMLNNCMSTQTFAFDFFFRVVDILNNETSDKIIETHCNKNFIECMICKIVN